MSATKTTIPSDMLRATTRATPDIAVMYGTLIASRTRSSTQVDGAREHHEPDRERQHREEREMNRRVRVEPGRIPSAKSTKMR